MNEKRTGSRTDNQVFDETIARENDSDTNSDGDFDADDMPDSLGRYGIEKLLGSGGMGAVYLAHDSQLDRKVALKIPKFDSGTDGKLVTRFYREARSAATLSHPNLCPVFDVGEIDGTHYIAMAYIKGRPLSSYVDAENPPAPKVVAAIVRKVALAMEEAHRNGIVHRDLKPANIMIDQRKEPIVMDFGLACPQDIGDDSRLTQDGALLGSPAYMSPERLKSEPDASANSADIYSLGVVLYELLTGQLPFQGAGSTVAMIGRILTEEATKLSSLGKDIDEALSDICSKAMAKKPEDRFKSMNEFAVALAKYIKNGAGVSGTLKDLKPLRSSDVSRIQLTEQSRVAKILCDSGQFAAALPFLEQIVANPAGKDTAMLQWANTMLPKVKAQVQREQAQAKQTQAARTQAARTQAARTQAVRTQAVPAEPDIFGSLPSTSAPAQPLRPPPRPRRKSTDKSGSKVGSIITLVAGFAIAVTALGYALSMVLSEEASPVPEQAPSSDAPSSETASSETASSAPQATSSPSTGAAKKQPRQPTATGAGQRRGRGQFGQYDLNRDGFLRKDEIPPAQLARIMGTDANGDGKISPSEFATNPPPSPGPPGNRPGVRGGPGGGGNGPGGRTPGAGPGRGGRATGPSGGPPQD